MSLESNEIVVGSFGHVYRAPTGTAFPTNISTAVNDALWTELGYLTEEGVRFAFSREVNEFFGWQSYHPLRIINSKMPTEVSFDCTQLNVNTWATAMGGGTFTEPTANNFVYEPPGEEIIDQFQLIVTWVDGTQDYRICFRKVQNMSGVEFGLTRENPILLPIVVKMLAPDTDVAPWFLQTDDENLGDPLLAGS